jgi:hypothetical protein
MCMAVAAVAPWLGLGLGASQPLGHVGGLLVYAIVPALSLLVFCVAYVVGRPERASNRTSSGASGA